ncbi:hypothetical protein DBZ36_01650 [Alginatibacterium sediminis]|uniref:MSHA biogenesis protein MshI n=1 Tax=Alginatibacterium sediminis TaxID=2164068 RepID=A0A420EKY7_9ALTE|nr:hypothetical protein [Alginatibacterium sediminis]RKF21382.1 hypothetical protein DBZ36_01650 [Alginatibacterium sediminis]
MKFPFLGGKNSKPHCAIYLKSDRVVLAYKKADEEHLIEQSVNSMKDWQPACQDLIQDADLSNHSVLIILSSEHYQLIQIEKPEVPEEELGSALPWAVKDMLAEDPGFYVLDYYHCVTANNTPQRINVVAVLRSLVVNLVAMFEELSLSLSAISCENVVLGNLLAKDDKTRLLLWQTAHSELEILVVCNTDIVFQRQLRGYSNLSSMQEIEFNNEMFDNLSLELQRSIDYLRSTLKQSAVSNIEVAISSAYVDSICTRLQDNFSIPVKSVSYELEASSTYKLESKKFCRLAAIAGLREEL